MKNTVEDILTKIQTRSPNDIARFDGQIHPKYDGLSIANIPASICRWLGCPPPVDRPLSVDFTQNFPKTYRHVIFIVVDGLGWEFLHSHNLDSTEGNCLPGWKALLQDGLLLPLTSIVPSTTSAALTTFWTGRLPAEHGIIGYEMFLKEYGFVANMILHSVSSFIGESGNLVKAGFNPETFLPVDTFGPYFKKHGIRPFALQPEPINGSGLSQMILKNTALSPYRSLEELWALAAEIQSNQSGRRSYTYIYWGELDTLSHQAGPGDAQLTRKWADFTRQLADFVHKLRPSSKSDTLLVLTADHGQIATGIHQDYDLRSHPELVSHLVMFPSGESRLPFLFTKPGHAGAMRDYLAGHWEGQFQMVPSETVLASGLLGSCAPYAGTVERLGQYVVFPRGNAYWWWVNKENRLLGRHGGLSKEEMLVPFFAMEI